MDGMLNRSALIGSLLVGATMAITSMVQPARVGAASAPTDNVQWANLTGAYHQVSSLSLHFLFDYYMVRLTKSLDHNIEDAIGDLLDHNRKVQR